MFSQRIDVKRRRISEGKRKRSRGPSLESLEDRRLLTAIESDHVSGTDTSGEYYRSLDDLSTSSESPSELVSLYNASNPVRGFINSNGVAQLEINFENVGDGDARPTVFFEASERDINFKVNFKAQEATDPRKDVYFYRATLPNDATEIGSMQDTQNYGHNGYIVSTTSARDGSPISSAAPGNSKRVSAVVTRDGEPNAGRFHPIAYTYNYPNLTYHDAFLHADDGEKVDGILKVKPGATVTLQGKILNMGTSLAGVSRFESEWKGPNGTLESHSSMASALAAGEHDLISSIHQVDTTGLPIGRYTVEFMVDADNSLIERDEIDETNLQFAHDAEIFESDVFQRVLRDYTDNNSPQNQPANSPLSGHEASFVFDVIDDAPSANATAPNITDAGGSDQTISVTYVDDIAIDVATILSGEDIQIDGPNGVRAATFANIDNQTNGTPRTANYILTPSQGSWGASDNGTYSIEIRSDSVRDTGGNSVAAGTIGSFEVDIPTGEIEWPTVDILDVAPDPRLTDAGIVSVEFSEAVSGVDISDFKLTRDGNVIELNEVDLAGGPTVWTIDLSDVTGGVGEYELILNASGSEIEDEAGNPLKAGAQDSWTVGGGSVRGIKFHDENGNGINDLGEARLAGWTIFADQNGNGKLDSNEPHATTREDDSATEDIDETGQFVISDLIGGTYDIREISQEGWIPTGAESYTLRLGDSVSVTFGDDDAFGSGPDTIQISDNLKSFFEPPSRNFPSLNYDEIPGLTAPADRNAGATFADLPQNILAATLTMRIRAGESGGQPGNVSPAEDAMWLGFAHDSGVTGHWFRRFGDSSDGGVPVPIDRDTFELTEESHFQRRFSPGFLTSTWNAGREELFTIDLAALPLENGTTRNLLPEINRHGFLDMGIVDDTGIDFVTLTVETAPHVTNNDFANQFVGIDFGDAPSPYQTNLEHHGARHTATGPTLGESRDVESAGVNSDGADADDTSGADDEDGVTFGSISVGQTNAVAMVNLQNAPGGAFLDAWIDFNQDGSWGGADELIADRVFVSEDDNVVEFDVPASSVSGNAVARFRVSSAGDQGFIGHAADGEVEDHLVAINTGNGSDVYVDSEQRLGHGDTFGVALADFDNDGDLDAIASSVSQQPVDIWSNDGSGSFELAQQIDLPQMRGVAAGDLDGDSDIDVVLANPVNHGENRILINQGGAQLGTVGTFAISDQTLPGNQTSDVVLADVDGDGDPDIVFANANHDADTLFINQGGVQGGVAGMFTDSGQRFGASRTTGALLADLDGDGDVDYYQSNTSGQPNRIFLNQGAVQGGAMGVFIDSGQSLGGGNTNQSVAIDIDADGDIDLVDANDRNQVNQIMVNQGGAQEGTPGVFAVGQAFGASSTFHIAAADFDADGDADVVTSDINGGLSQIWINQGGSQSGTPGNLVAGQSLSGGFFPSVAVGDLNGDAAIDIFLGAATNGGVSSGSNEIWLGQRQQQPFSVEVTLNVGEPSHADNLVVGDSFDIEVRFTDIRAADPQAVFSGYADLLFDETMIAIDEIISYAPAFGSGQKGEILDGQVDEAGATSGQAADDQDLVFTLRATALAAGITTVSSNEPEDLDSQITVHGDDDDQRHKTSFGELILEIAEPQPDLVVEATDALSDHVLNGQTTVTWTLANRGPGTAGAFTVNVVLSDDDTIGNEDDILLETISYDGLDTTESLTDILFVQLPKDVLNRNAQRDDTPGLPRGHVSTSRDVIGLIVDPDNSIDETNEQNNSNLGKGVDSDDVTYFPWDIDGNGAVTPTDCVFVVNRLGEESPPADARADSNGDGIISPRDLISCVNRLGILRNDSVIEPQAEPVAAVMADLDESPHVEVSMDLVELDATPGILIGEQFDVNLRFSDVRDRLNPQAVYSGYADVHFDADLVRVDAIRHSDQYTLLRKGETAFELVDTVGGTIGGSPSDDDIVATLTLTARAGGGTLLASSSSDDRFADVTVYGSDDDQRSRTSYGSLPICIGSAPPSVSQVFVASSHWNDRFVDQFENGGFGFAIPASAPVLPWAGLNEVSIAFDADVIVAQNNLRITGNRGDAYSIESFHYDQARRTATWSLGAGESLGADNIVLSLTEDVVASNGCRLNSDGLGGTGSNVSPNGNVNTGVPFQFSLQILPGDTNGSLAVAVNDLGAIRLGLGSRVGDQDYSPFADLNGSGGISVDDVPYLVDNLGRTLRNAIDLRQTLPLKAISTFAIDRAILAFDEFGDDEWHHEIGESDFEPKDISKLNALIP